MKKCKNCQVNDARYICLGCSREFCNYCMKEDEFLCSQCRYNKQHENQKQQRQQENKSKLKKNNHRIINIIYIIIASSILFLGIILVLTSYSSLINMISSSSNGPIYQKSNTIIIETDLSTFFHFHLLYHLSLIVYLLYL